MDPAVQLWNRPLADNLRYGWPVRRDALESAIDAAEFAA